MTDYSGAGRSEKLHIENLGVDEECEKSFKDLKMRRKYRYVTYGIDVKEKLVKVFDKGDHAESFDNFLSALPPSQCRYAVYDHEFTKDGRKQDKLLFVTWCPRSADTNTKMLYATERPRVADWIVGAFQLNVDSIGEIKDYLGMDAGSDEDLEAEDDAWLSD